MTIAHTHSGGAPEPKLSRSMTLWYPMSHAMSESGTSLAPFNPQDRRRTKNKSLRICHFESTKGKKKKDPPSSRPKKICPTCNRSHESVKFHGEACWLSIPANPYRIHGNITNQNNATLLFSGKSLKQKKLDLRTACLMPLKIGSQLHDLCRIKGTLI